MYACTLTYSKSLVNELYGDGGLSGTHWDNWIKVYMKQNPEAKENFGYLSFHHDIPLASVAHDHDEIVNKLKTKHTVFRPFSANGHAYLVIITADKFYVYINGSMPVPRRAARLYEALQKTEKKRTFVEIRSPVQRGGNDCVAFMALMATTWMAGTEFTEEVAAREIPKFRATLKKYMLEAKPKPKQYINFLD